MLFLTFPAILANISIFIRFPSGYKVAKIHSFSEFFRQGMPGGVVDSTTPFFLIHFSAYYATIPVGICSVLVNKMKGTSGAVVPSASFFNVIVIMSDWSLPLNILGRILLAFYFLKAGINNAWNWQKVKGLLKVKNVPLPGVSLFIVIFIEIIGSLAIIFNFYASLAAIALILFTLAANFLICNYWTMEGLHRRNVSFVFYANIAIIGALLLISSSF